MQKVRIVSLEEDKARVVAALHHLGAIDLRRSKLTLEDDKPRSDSTAISDALLKVDGALQLLPIHKVSSEGHRDARHLVQEVSKLAVLDTIYGLGSERKAIDDDQRLLDYAHHVATASSGIDIDFGRIRSDYVLYRAFETDAKGHALLRKHVSKLAIKDMEVNVAKAGKGDWFILIAHSKGSSIDEALKGVQLSELDLTAQYLSGAPQDVLRAVGKKRAENAKRLSQIDSKLAEISRSSYSRLSNLKEMLEIELERADASASFKKTDSSFIVEGWVQKRQVGELTKRLLAVTKGRAYLEELEADELAPTHTRRPKFLQPFDYLVSFYSVQRSDEIDPTWIFIFAFPIFYGLMVTDVGYGVASLILATYISRKTDPEGLMYNVSKLWQLNALAAMFFGFISNQYFGFQLPYSTPFNFDWLKNTPELIAITVLFGVVQVCLGLLLGIFNSYRHGHKKLAFARFTSILTVAFGTIAVSGAFFGAFSGTVTDVSAAIAIVSVALTAVFSGSEATEIVSLITHPLSYARIMGFGLSSVIIAFLIDMAFTPHLSSGILVFLLYAAIFILLHFVNMVLGIFEGLVQGVRLNFVEFFTKFYTGNGIKFKPFSYKRVYTKE